jgi:hypothetical protein
MHKMETTEKIQTECCTMNTLLIRQIMQTCSDRAELSRADSATFLRPETTDNSMSAEKITYNDGLLRLATTVADLEMVPRGRL